MVGVAVAMVISTMHEKSCIDSHDARKFEKSSKIQSFTHLAIIMMKLRRYHSHEFLSYHNYTTQLFRKLFLTKLSQNSYFNYHWFHQKYLHVISKTDCSHYFPFTYICVHILCRFSDTGIIMTSQRRCYARDLQNHAYNFIISTMHDSPPPASELCLQISASSWIKTK